ncbi:hypothetical protein F4806DRAFT_500906 [Annulohypoxylon nitens]|nr:hypothetical protein F4806DRAFT_500906 [Annulohypoxylon nitens]
MVLCRTAEIYRQIEITSGEPEPEPIPSGKKCVDFDEKYVRMERVYYTKCEDCCKEIAAADPDMEPTMPSTYSLLMRESLVHAVATRRYAALVRVLPTEFNIKQRFMLSGCRWVEAPQPKLIKALGPHPPVDTELEGLQWWYEQGMCGKIHDEIVEWFNSVNQPKDRISENDVDWTEEFPSSPDQFPEIDNRSLSQVSEASSWEDRISLSDRRRIADLVYDPFEDSE